MEAAAAAAAEAAAAAAAAAAPWTGRREWRRFNIISKKGSR